MFLSLIVPFRNREAMRVERCLQSLENQTYGDFEIIFADFGSKKEISEQVKTVCGKFSRVKHFYSHTEGRLWSPGHARNIGIKQASGEFLMTVDIDMIYSPHFLENAVKELRTKRLLCYQCYYLPENFTDYEKLPNIDTAGLEESDKTSAKGIFFMERKAVLEIAGFDEYFRIWGMEDMDLFRRFALQNFEIVWLDLKKNPVFHQWHPFSDEKENMPKGWKQVMIDYYHAKTPQDLIPQESFGNITTAEARLPLMRAREEKSGKTFTFAYPNVKYCVDFAKTFNEMSSGEVLNVRQRFDLLPEDQPGKLTKVFTKINRWLDKTKLSYRVVELLSYERELPDYYGVRDFLFYFIHANERYIADYYFEYRHHNIDLSLLKK